MVAPQYRRHAPEKVVPSVSSGALKEYTMYELMFEVVMQIVDGFKMNRPWFKKKNGFLHLNVSWIEVFFW